MKPTSKTLLLLRFWLQSLTRAMSSIICGPIVSINGSTGVPYKANGATAQAVAPQAWTTRACVLTLSLQLICKAPNCAKHSSASVLPKPGTWPVRMSGPSAKNLKNPKGFNSLELAA